MYGAYKVQRFLKKHICGAESWGETVAIVYVQAQLSSTSFEKCILFKEVKILDLYFTVICTVSLSVKFPS